MASPSHLVRPASGAGILALAIGSLALVGHSQDFSPNLNNIFPLAPRELRQNLAHAHAAARRTAL